MDRDDLDPGGQVRDRARIDEFLAIVVERRAEEGLEVAVTALLRLDQIRDAREGHAMRDRLAHVRAGQVGRKGAATGDPQREMSTG